MLPGLVRLVMYLAEMDTWPNIVIFEGIIYVCLVDAITGRRSLFKTRQILYVSQLRAFISTRRPPREGYWRPLTRLGEGNPYAATRIFITET